VTQPDALVRIALAAMAADPTSGLTEAERTGERDSIKTLLEQTTPLTAQDRARWKEKLLAWVRTTVPGAVEIIEQQF
jgi:hypothetical protein